MIGDPKKCQEKAKQKPTNLYNVIIKQQPESMTLYNGDVVSTVGATV